MINLISISQAKAQIHIGESDNTHDGDIAAKIRQASGITLRFLKITIPEETSPIEESPTLDDWELNGVPHYAQAMCATAFAELWYGREAGVINVLSEGWVNLGRMYRTPTIV